ncbi:MAG: FHA domain-containing protein [Gemmatimonadota bacterium]|nr:FHA domain-containing protein [Gemmatimonadota bacterium]
MPTVFPDSPPSLPAADAAAVRPSPAPHAAPAQPASLVDVRWALAYPLTRLCTGIGRDAGNPILIRDLAASRSHCEIQRAGDAYVLHPVGSAETKVNGMAVTAPRALAEGDVIEIAYTRLRFTRRPPAGDVLPAPEHAAVDPDFAAHRTEVREIVSTEKLQELRRHLSRPVSFNPWLMAGAIVGGALVVALAILLVRRLWPG